MITRISLIMAFIFVLTSSVLALELPENLKEYFKDNVSSAPGTSEGVAPTEKPKVQKGVDIGRRETKEFDFSDESIGTLIIKCWEALTKKDEAAMLAYTSRCIELYRDKAKKQNETLSEFAQSGSEAEYEYLNNVAVCYFIQGEFYKHFKDWNKARPAYKEVVDNFYFAQYWDPRGWWWKPAEIAKGEVEKIDSGYYEKL